ncbi:unnamed protein product [Fraxinus pennsylvanica]|uniref:Uncharacterized protein n=1 Tax=Fraxinus pennsylvanica TaxID=56036 RepID=A0AAD1ZZ33_9LAMI|nr:unnamed protein product [Fraxinus pennsylvanica]
MFQISTPNIYDDDYSRYYNGNLPQLEELLMPPTQPPSQIIRLVFGAWPLPNYLYQVVPEGILSYLPASFFPVEIVAVSPLHRGISKTHAFPLITKRFQIDKCINNNFLAQMYCNPCSKQPIVRK